MPNTDSGKAVHGGIVEIDEEGKLIRAASTADPARPSDLLMAYSLLPLPDIDRVLVTNSSMRDEDKTGHTYQIFRLSDLTRLSTNDLDAPAGSYGEINPEEARRGPDGSVYFRPQAAASSGLRDSQTLRHAQSSSINSQVLSAAYRTLFRTI
jgi:hypothetical protein